MNAKFFNRTVLSSIALASACILLVGCIAFPNLPNVPQAKVSIVDGRTLLGWCGDAATWTEISVSYSAVKPTYVRENVTAKGEWVWGGDTRVLDLEDLPETLVETRRDPVHMERIDNVSVYLTGTEGEKFAFAFAFEQGALAHWPQGRWLSTTGAWSDSMCT